MTIPKYLRPIKPDYKPGETVRVVLGSKETVYQAKIISHPDGSFVSTRMVTIQVEGEPAPRKISLDRVIGR